MVHARKLFLGGRPGFTDIAAAPSPVARDDLHDLGALDSLGMTGRIQMVSETVGCENGQAHRSNSTLSRDAVRA